MRICGKCKKELDLNQFSFRNKEKGTLQSWCKVCQKGSALANYQRNKKRYIKRATENTKARAIKHARRLYDYLSDHPCIDCGETNPIVLEFDHRNRSEKVDHVSRMAGQGWSWERIEKEIEKCDVRCANCHRIKTTKELGWIRYAISQE